MRSILFTLLIFTASKANASKEADSLKSIWQNTEVTDTVRMNALRTVAGDVYMRTNPDTAFYYAQIML